MKMVDRQSLKHIDFRSLAILAVSTIAIFLFGKVFLSNIVDLPNTLQDFFTLALGIFVEAFPFLVLGSLLAAIVRVFVPDGAIFRILPKHGALKRLVLSLTGFIFPVCECGNVPVSRAMIIQGLKPSDAITFLLAAPVINPVTIWSTWVAFGGDKSIVASRVIATLIIANFIGFIISLHKKQQNFLTDEFNEVCELESKEKSKSKPKAQRFGNVFTHEAFDMLKLLAFGALIAGAVQTFVPREVLVNIGSNVILSILAMMALGFIISICANVDAFFALSFKNIFTNGSIVSFLVFGPMIDIKMLIMLKTTFKTNLLIIITTLSFLLSFLTGLVVTYAF